MKEISNISDLKKGKIYYIHVKSHERLNMKLRGKFYGNYEDYIFISDLEYINHHYDDLRFPYCKPIYLRLWKVNGKLYKFVSKKCLIKAKEFPNLYEPCKIYEPQKENILVNFVMRNKIINDPYFDWLIL